MYKYGCESWTVKKAERRRIDAFELWCWRRLLRVPWTARRSNQSILKEISPGCSLEGLMLKLKLQYFGHLMRRVDLLEKTDAGRDWGQEEKGMTEDEMAGWHHRLDGRDRKSTRLNSSHHSISYAVFCLKKKKKRNRKSNHHRQHRATRRKRRPAQRT